MRRPLRVCQLTPTLLGGGTEERVARVLGSLDRSLFAVSWLGFGPVRPELAKTARTVPISVERDAHTTGVEIRTIIRVARALRRIRADVVHVHNWSTSLYGIAGAALAGTPAVLYGSGGRETATGASKRQRRLMRALAPHVSMFTAVCRFLADELRTDWKIGPERVRVIHTGIDLERFAHAPSRRAARERLGLPPDAVVVGTIGVIRPVKRTGDLIRAVGQLARERAYVHLVVAGPCFRVDPARLQALAAAEGLSERFHLLGRVNEPAAVLPAFDIFVNCSEFEGASNAIIEAMATRLPVVGTRVGGTPELVADGFSGILVEPRKPSALARALARLVNDARARETYGSNGRKRVEERHTLNAMLREISAAYQSARAEAPPLATRARTVQRVAESLVRMIQPT